MYLIIQKCSMHIKITSVCRYEGEIEAFKSMSVKFEQKPDDGPASEVFVSENSVALLLQK
jgi:hypothetical protein